MNRDQVMVAKRRVTIVNQRGLHARAAAKFVKLAGSYEAEILV
ncbi:MAG: HPr family phosphocarrier protein, partial [Kiloniellales bacterium]|nr:HPr family phosphocarrier protein [Kiloniellales bacterium]